MKAIICFVVTLITLNLSIKINKENQTNIISCSTKTSKVYDEEKEQLVDLMNFEIAFVVVFIRENVRCFVFDTPNSEKKEHPTFYSN